MATRRAGSKRAADKPAPSAAALHELALSALSRRALSRKAMSDALDRSITTWSRGALRGGRDPDEVEREASRAREHIEGIVARLVETGLVNDASFATARAERLSRAGKSRRAISFHLSGKGIDEQTARAAISTDPDDELRAALVLARRKRLGPFARPEPDRDRDEERAARQKAFATFARAGFGLSTTERVLRIDLEEAEERMRGRGIL